MKILVFNWRDIRNPNAGGAERYTHEIFRRIVKKGNEVTLFAAEFSGCKKEEFIDGIRIVRAGNRFSVYWNAKKYYKKYFSKEGFDVVIDEINTIPFFTPKFVKEPVVALIHQLAREFWFYETPFPASLIGRYCLENRWLRNYLDISTVTVSESTKKDLMDLGFRRISIVHNGVNVETLKKVPRKNKDPAIIYVGRMKKAKKPQDVLKAFETVKERSRNAELWMIGDGYLRNKLERKVRKGVKFFGYVDEKRKIELMKRAWVIVVPGVREGWGQVVTDANALGTPAVAYDVPGLRDSVRNNFNGLLADGNPKDFADGIIKVLEDNKLREMLRKNAIIWSNKFSWDKSTEDFEKIIKNVVK